MLRREEEETRSAEALSFSEKLMLSSKVTGLLSFAS